MILPPPRPRLPPSPSEGECRNQRHAPRPAPSPREGAGRNRRRPSCILDPLSQHYADRLEGGYDCVDRIVFNAYFLLGGVLPGGFRSWWRFSMARTRTSIMHISCAWRGASDRRLRAGPTGMTYR